MGSMRNLRKVDQEFTRKSKENLQKKTIEIQRNFIRNSLGFRKELNINSEDNLKKYSRKFSRFKNNVWQFDVQDHCVASRKVK